jgi:hypothetical protein
MFILYFLLLYFIDTSFASYMFLPCEFPLKKFFVVMGLNSGLLLATQVLNHLSHIHKPYSLVILEMMAQGSSWTMVLPISASQVSGIRGMRP